MSSPLSSVAAAVWAVGRSAVVHTLVEPVRDGGPLPQCWPRPVRRVMTLALVAYGVLMVSVLVSGLAPPAPSGFAVLSLPGRVLAAFGIGLVLFLLLAASIHLPLVLSVLIGIFVALTLVLAALTSIVWTVTFGELALVAMIGLFGIYLVQWIGIVALCVLGRRQPVSGRRLAALGMLVGTSYVLPLLIAIPVQPHDDPKTTILTAFPMLVLFLAAAPIAVASGTAYAEVTLRAVTWTVLETRKRVPTPFWMVVVAALTGVIVYRTITLRPGALVLYPRTLILVGVAACGAGVCIALARRRRARTRPVPPRPTDLAEALPRFTYLIAPFLVWPALWQWGDIAGLPPYTFWLGFGAVVALGGAVLAVRRGNPVLAALAPPIAAGLIAYSAITLDIRLLSDPVMSAMLSALLLAALIWWAVTGRLGSRQWVIVSLGLALVVVFPVRSVLAEPIGAALGFSAVAVVFFGLIWRVLTDGGYTRVGSARFPLDARAFVFAAHALTAATGVMMAAYGNWPEVFDLELMATWGDGLAGRYVLIAVVIGLIEIGRFDVDPNPDEPIPASRRLRRRLGVRSAD